MSGKHFASTLISLCIFLWDIAGTGAQTPDDPLLDRLLEISSVSQFEWSPQGDRIAYVSNRAGTNQIYILDLDNMESRRITHRGSPVTDPRWSPDGRSLIYLTDPDCQERFEAWRYDFSADREERILSNVGAIQRNIRWSPDGSRLVLETNAGGNFDVAIRTIDDPVLHPVAASQRDEESPDWIPDSSAISFVSRGSVWKVDAEGGDPEQIVSPGLGAGLQTPRWSPDGDYLLFGTDQSGYWNIGLYSDSDRTWWYIAPEPYEQSEPSWSRDGQRLAFISARGFDRRVAVMDLSRGRLQYVTGERTVSASPQWSPSGNRLAFLMSSPRQTQDLWIYEDGSLNRLTDSMAGWEDSEFSSPEDHSYTAREGFEIPGLLYKPVNFDPGKRYPAVIVIHGGFYGQWLNSFEQLGQYLLQRGMVLFYPNPRGGGGYGRMYERLNDGDWGGGDLDDLIRADNYVKALPFVDDNRVGIWGGSYGGYLVYALVTAAPERFQAAVVRAGISELRSHMTERFYSPGRFNDTLSYARQLGGLPDENPDFYRERSPLNHVENVKTPMLIMHGLRDNRVAPSQSRIWAQALREKGIPVVEVRYPDEDHSLLRSKTTMHDQLRRMSDLFEAYLGLEPNSEQ